MDSLSLFPATSSQITESHRNNYASWSKGLTLEIHLQKEHLLQSYPHAFDGKFVVWVLAPRDDPTTLEFLCACETYRRTGLSKSSNDEVAQEVTCYGIASVYTPERNRGKGYASHMMSLLHWVLAPPSSHRLVTFPKAWGQPPRPIPGFQNAKFSVLYSDVGPNFYARAGPTPDGTGWVVRNPISTIWQLKEIKTASTTPIWLSEKEVYYHLERESARMKDELPKKSYTFLPNEGVCGFLIKRTVRFPSADKPEWPSPIWGVALEDSFATWTFDMAIPVPALVITYFHSSEEEFPELLAHIGAFAKTFGNIQVIEGWNVPEEFRGGAVTKTRDDHLSAVIWYGDETDRGEYRWAWNEKFAWC